MHVDVPSLMRSHMYVVQYRKPALARDTMAGIEGGRGLAGCEGCESCKLSCRNNVQIGRKIAQLRTLARDNFVC